MDVSAASDYGCRDMKNPIDFYFDFVSPYAYIASEWVAALAARHARTVRWHAVLLGVTFAAAELKSPVTHPVKRDYVLRDIQRSARFEGVPYVMPEQLLVSSLLAARVFWWLNDSASPDVAAAWARAGLRARFTRGVVLDDPQALKALAAESGLDAAAAQAAWGDALWKARLKRANDEAIAAGVFGTPFFVADGEPFWGNDRKPQIERWLAQGPY